MTSPTAESLRMAGLHDRANNPKMLLQPMRLQATRLQATDRLVLRLLMDPMVATGLRLLWLLPLLLLLYTTSMAGSELQAQLSVKQTRGEHIVIPNRINGTTLEDLDKTCWGQSDRKAVIANGTTLEDQDKTYWGQSDRKAAIANGTTLEDQDRTCSGWNARKVAIANARETGAETNLKTILC